MLIVPLPYHWLALTLFMFLNKSLKSGMPANKKVQVPTPKTEVGKNLINNQVLIP